jgi:hypothetical protein
VRVIEEFCRQIPTYGSRRIGAFLNHIKKLHVNHKGSSSSCRGSCFVTSKAWLFVEERQCFHAYSFPKTRNICAKIGHKHGNRYHSKRITRRARATSWKEIQPVARSC